MKKHRLIIQKHGKLTGIVEGEGEDGKQLLELIDYLLPKHEGYVTQKYVSRGERRILESTPECMRLLISETLYE
jgi:hypothetical protein